MGDLDLRAGYGAERLQAAVTPIRVLIVEDHFTLADSLTLALELQSDMECAGIAGTVSQALELVAFCEPDVVLMDVRLPDGSGIDATAQIREIRPATSVLVLTAHPDPELAARAADAGAAGFLRKVARVNDILRAIRMAAAGELSLDATALRALVPALPPDGPRPPRAGVANLTSREAEVLTLMVAGIGPKAIAARLDITVSTCRSYVKAILQKLGVHSQLEAVALATRQGLVTPTAGEP